MKISKNIFRSTFVLVLAISFMSVVSSCKKDEGPDLTTEITDDYTGVMVVSPDFTSDDYTVTVTKVNNHRIKITPEDNHASTFEVNIKEGDNGVIVSDETAITISFENNHLSYAHVSGGHAEEFSGDKQ